MVNDIINGIAKALSKEFGDEYTIYTDEVEHGFKEPCFFISSLALNSKQVLGKRYKNDNSFTVTYFPKKNSQKERTEVFERLCECLEYIYIGENEELIRGANMKSETSDGVLLFFIDYDLFSYKFGEKNEPMEELNYKGRIV